MKSKVEIYSRLVLGVMMLLIPVPSIANAQEYDARDYEKDPITLIKYDFLKNKHKKRSNDSPMLVVTKEVLFCNAIANGTGNSCGFSGPIEGPDSGSYVPECTNPSPGQDTAVCNNVNDEFFEIIVTDDITFPGSEDGTKLNLNGERYTVTERVDISSKEVNSACKEAGFDVGFVNNVEGAGAVIFCLLYEGKCSGIVQDGELKECTIKNYVVNSDPF